MEFEITITYRLRGDDCLRVETLEPHEFFDLDPGESPSLDSVHAHPHAVDYLDCPVTALDYTRLTVRDLESNRDFEIRETFWNQGQCRLIERRDFRRDNGEYEEVILDLTDPDRTNKSSIIKFRHGPTDTQLVYHVLVTHNPDGTESETRIYPACPPQKPIPG